MQSSTPQRPSSRPFALLALLLLALVPESAGAVMTLDLVWTATTGAGTVGSDVIEAVPGDELDLDIIATVDAAGVDAYQVSVAFDLNALDELDLIETIELDHVANPDCDPLIEEQLGPFPACFENFGNELVNSTPGIFVETESGSGTQGLAGGFEAAAGKLGPGEGVVSLSFRVGRIRFLVTDNVATNGDDLEGSLFLVAPDPSDAYIDDQLTTFIFPEDLPDPSFVPGFARVDVPEPAGGALALAAVATLVALRRSAALRVARARP